jgi:hypothetical protein
MSRPCSPICLAGSGAWTALTDGEVNESRSLYAHGSLCGRGLEDG